MHASLLLITVPHGQLLPLRTCFRVRVLPSLEGLHRFKKKRMDMVGEVHLNFDSVRRYITAGLMYTLWGIFSQNP